MIGKTIKNEEELGKFEVISVYSKEGGDLLVGTNFIPEESLVLSLSEHGFLYRLFPSTDSPNTNILKFILDETILKTKSPFCIAEQIDGVYNAMNTKENRIGSSVIEILSTQGIIFIYIGDVVENNDNIKIAGWLSLIEDLIVHNAIHESDIKRIETITIEDLEKEELEFIDYFKSFTVKINARS